jgi:hypothetical protein
MPIGRRGNPEAVSTVAVATTISNRVDVLGFVPVVRQAPSLRPKADRARRPGPSGMAGACRTPGQIRFPITTDRSRTSSHWAGAAGANRRYLPPATTLRIAVIVSFLTRDAISSWTGSIAFIQASFSAGVGV